ncbi:CatU [Paenibacillus sp. LC231]|uniref:type A chloramphenicol O-acetyltransferase n=1 Tax=Paenibacillus sp. LC231 TaxID=1120679 RepID=UPI0008DCF0AE|nr:type A chloramphenicol O-acetyltransferase [Paenibacillus sp. LC231]APB03217.1 chloramphenicol acetyltransferase [Paenibacillus sp. LC231]OIB04412.1 CatU [Paenibacillus sp. LC231]
MKFHIINVEEWTRKPYYEHYLRSNKCTFSITVDIDITRLLYSLKANGFKLYPAFIYMVTRVVNDRVEFKTSFSPEGELGYWDRMTPSYTFFHNDDHTFSCLWTAFSNDFYRFHDHYEQDMEQYRDTKGLFVKENPPPNTFPISMIPWTSFSGFNLNIVNEADYLLPIITGGKYTEQGGRVLLPVSLQVHHAVCDGYHASMFFKELQSLADSFEDWLT